MRGSNRRTLALSFVVGLIGLAGPSSASAHDELPPDPNPAGWWWEALGSQTGGFDSNIGIGNGCYRAESTPPESGGGYRVVLSCTQHWGDGSADCTAGSTHNHSPGTPGKPVPLNSEGFDCSVYPSAFANECTRSYDWQEFPGSSPQSSDTGWVPQDCRLQLPGWPDDPGTGQGDKCQQAKAKVKKAKQQLQEADSPEAKAKAKQKLKKAKKKKREACGPG